MYTAPSFLEGGDSNKDSILLRNTTFPQVEHTFYPNRNRVTNINLVRNKSSAVTKVRNRNNYKKIRAQVENAEDKTSNNNGTTKLSVRLVDLDGNKSASWFSAVV